MSWHEAACSEPAERREETILESNPGAGAVQSLPTCRPLLSASSCHLSSPCQGSCSFIPVNCPTSLLKSQLESVLSHVSSTKLPACSDSVSLLLLMRLNGSERTQRCIQNTNAGASSRGREVL